MGKPCSRSDSPARGRAVTGSPRPACSPDSCSLFLFQSEGHSAAGIICFFFFFFLRWLCLPYKKGRESACVIFLLFLQLVP